jgi:hypothetical protein
MMRDTMTGPPYRGRITDPEGRIIAKSRGNDPSEVAKILERNVTGIKNTIERWKK